jgi:hypothetical protein
VPSPEFLLKGVAAPLLIAFAATLVSMRLSAGLRGVAAFGLFAGQAAGLALAVWGQKDWLPDRNSEWVPWTTLGAAVIGPMVVASGLASLERWLLAGLASLAAAALIVPTWPDLWPTRWVSMLAVTAAFTLLARGIDAVASRCPLRLVIASMSLTAWVAAMLIAASLSFTLAQSVVVTAAALAGASAALLFRPDERAVRAVALPYAVGIGGFCYVSAIELLPPAPMLIGLLFVPPAPLVLWLIATGPLAQKRPRVRWSVGLAVVVIYLLAVGAWTWSSTESTGDEYAFVQSSRNGE